MINVGLVGYGMAGRVFHAPLIDSSQQLHLHTIVQRHSDSARERYPGIRIAKSLEDMLADELVEVVVIATPNTSHFDLAETALRAGRHVVIDKPFTNSLADADKLMELATNNNCLLSVFHNRRWDGDFKTVKEIIAQQLIGELVEFESCFERFRNYFKPDAWREQAQPGSGILFDIGSHLIDQAVQLFGEPLSITADIRNQRQGGKTDDSFEVRFDYENNLKVLLRGGMLAKRPRPRFRLNGTLGSYVKHGLDPQEEALKSGKLPGEDDWGTEDEQYWGMLDTTLSGVATRGRFATLPGDYISYYDGIAKAIQNKSEPPVTADQARMVIRYLELARASSEQRKSIDLT
jgi:predicted dehydrogenase